MYAQKIAHIFDHIQEPQMVLDHSRLGLENKLGRIFLLSTGLLYKLLPTNLGVCKPTFYTLYTSHLRWNRPWTEWGISQFFKTNCTLMANIQDDQSWAISETVRKSSKITYTASRFSFLVQLSVWSSIWMNFNRVTLQHNNEFIMLIYFFI